MSETLRKILSELRKRLEKLYGQRLHETVLYGSQSRQDAIEGSDIDVMVVLDGTVNSAEEISRTINDVSDLSLQHNVVVSCLFVSTDEYQHGQTPLLLNVRREGVRI